MEIRELDATHRADAVALWHRTEITRQWNPPEEDFDRAVRGPSSVVPGGFEGSRLVASAMVGHQGHRGWVYYLAVEPDRRSAGSGRALMQAAEDWVRAAGIPKIQLMVRAANGAALGFYGALGLRPRTPRCCRAGSGRPETSAPAQATVAPSPRTQSSAVTTVAWRGKTFSRSTRWTSGSASAQPSDRTVSS